jgi:hypothetical protein
MGAMHSGENESLEDLLASLSAVLNVGQRIDRTTSPDDVVSFTGQKQAGQAIEEPVVLPEWLISPPKRSRHPTYIPLKTIRQAEVLILDGLRQIPEFPDRGINVTVYGSRPWSAMLTFKPNSTSHQNALQYREVLTQIVFELRKQFEIELVPDEEMT